MSYVKEKVSYLRGLSDGLDVQEPALKKLFAAVIDALDALADGVEENEAAIVELDECVDDLYDAFDELEDELCDCCDCDCCNEDDDCFDEDEFVEVQCPHCGETVFFDEDMLAENKALICPSCNQDVITEFEEGDEE